MNYRCIASAAAALALALAAGGCGTGGGDTAPAGEPEVRPNVVVVLADTLRADHLGAYGYPRDTSPRFDALAADSYLFEDVRAQAPCTFPSVNSILTGRLPHRFFGQPEGGMGIPPTIPSIAELLRRTGYATAAISASPVVRATPGSINPGGGFAGGFDRFSENCEWQDAACVNRRAERFLDRLPEPFFLYLHYFDPHDPYLPPAHWPRRFAGEGAGLSEATRRGDPNPIARALYKNGDASLATPEAIAHLTDLYDEEIGFWDFQLGRLVDGLRERRLLDRTILVVLSDHGESLYQHGHLRHCRSLFDTEIKTPLLVRLPPSLRAAPPHRIAVQTANLDVVPTLLDYAGIDARGLELEGASLRPTIDGEDAARAPVYASWAGLRAVKDGRFKLLIRAADGESWLYDVESDPEESEDVASEHPRDAGRLKRFLRELMAQTEAPPPKADDEAMDRLRGLGYLQ